MKNLYEILGINSDATDKQIIKAVTVIDFDSSFIEKSSDCPMCRDDFERALRVFKAIISVIDKDGVYDNKFHNIIGECDG